MLRIVLSALSTFSGHDLLALTTLVVVPRRNLRNLAMHCMSALKLVSGIMIILSEAQREYIAVDPVARVRVPPARALICHRVIRMPPRWGWWYARMIRVTMRMGMGPCGRTRRRGGFDRNGIDWGWTRGRAPR
jgi:hypothetical protein